MRQASLPCVLAMLLLSGCGSMPLLAQLPSPAEVLGTANPPAPPPPGEQDDARADAQRAPAASGPPQTVTGRVLSAEDKRPLPNATVQLTREPGGPGSSLTTRTDAAGRYHFDAQAAGTYTLHASAGDGYVGSLYLEHGQFSAAIVLGKGLDTEHLDFELVPAASLHGRIVDEVGEPIQRAAVTLFRKPDAQTTESTGDAAAPATTPRRVRSTQTDEEGRYSFETLQPGTFYVSVSAQPWYAVHPTPDRPEARQAYRAAVDPALDVTYPLTFYPNAMTEDGAKPIAVAVGKRASANFQLTPHRAVQITLRMPQPAAGEQQSGYFRAPMFFRKVFGVEQQVQVNQGFPSSQDRSLVTVNGLDAGNYEVRTAGPRGITGGVTMVSAAAGSSPVDLTAASSPTRVVVSVAAADGATLPDGMEVRLQPIPMGAGLASSKVVQGRVEFTSVSAGEYAFNVSSGRQRWSVSRVQIGGKPVQPRRLKLMGEADVEVGLAVARFTPGLRGTVADGAGKPVAGAMVVLVPAGADATAGQFRRDESDLDGGFHISTLLPGNYLLIAIADGWRLRWNDVATLQPYLMHAVPVVIAASESRIGQMSDRVQVQPLH